MLRWVHVLWHILQALWLNFDLVLLVEDQKLAATPGRYAVKLGPTVTCSLQPSDPKLPTNHLSKNYLKPGKENLLQTKS